MDSAPAQHKSFNGRDSCTAKGIEDQITGTREIFDVGLDYVPGALGEVWVAAIVALRSLLLRRDGLSDGLDRIEPIEQIIVGWFGTSSLKISK